MCSVLYVSRTVIFSLEGAIKRSTGNVRMPRRRKKECRETKNGNMNNVAFYAVSSSSQYGHLCPKLNTKVKTQKSPVSNTEHTCIQNTMSHIGFRMETFLVSKVSQIVTYFIFSSIDRKTFSLGGVQNSRRQCA